MTTKPNEPEGLVTLAEAARDLIRAMHDDQAKVGYRLDLWNVLQACLDAPAHPVADAGGVTDADREAADAISVALLQCVSPDIDLTHFRLSVADLFARHRLQSVAAATAAKDAEVARLREALDAIARKGVDMRSDFSRSAEQSRIARAALSEAREAGG